MTSPRTCSGRFGVYEFGEEDEHPETFAKQTFAKFFNHGYDDNRRKRRSSSSSSSSSSSCLNKCNFLQLSRFGKEKVGSKPIDVDNAAVGGCKNEAKRKESSFSVDDVIADVDEGVGGCKTEARTKESGHKAINLDDSADVDEGGIDKSNFSVYDPSWSEGQQAVKSPDEFFSRHNESFEGVIIYPKGDPDAVSVSKRDMELLQPDTFVNDTIIDFYIKYLQSKIPPEHQHKFHFFNSFFFRKLSDMDKHSSDPHKCKVAFQRVYKWTRKVNLFDKDYIFIPVNYRLHWSLIVICSPGEVVHSRDDGSEGFVTDPCILHMDSIKGSHKDLGDLVRRYLCEEWKQRHNDTVDGVSSKFLHLRFVPLELPQQENLSDCGLFLLHYVELFIKEASINFSPLKSTKLSNFLTRGWFHPKEASMKRPRIQQLISEVLKDQSNNLSEKDPSHSEVAEEPGEHVSYSFSDTAGQLQIRTNHSMISYLGEDTTSLGRCQIEEVSDASSSSKSSEIGTDDHMHPEFDGFDRSNDGDRQESSSSVKNLLVCVVEDSEEENSTGTDDDAEGKESPSCFLNIGYGTWGSILGSKRRKCKRTKSSLVITA